MCGFGGFQGLKKVDISTNFLDRLSEYKYV